MAQQRRWAVVFSNGIVHSGYIRYCRRDVIKDVITDFRMYGSMKRYADLSDAQFWRVIKRRRGWLVRKVSLRVVR
jgi:hypothetical protein